MLQIVRGRLLALVLAVPLALPAAAAAEYRGDVVREWNDLAFSAIRSTSGSDGAAARLYAMVNAAIFDAVNGTDGSGPDRAAAFVAPDKKVNADAMVAAATAAHDVLVFLYPSGAFPAQYDSALDADIAAAQSSAKKVAAGQAWGAKVADAVLAAREDDGASPAFTIPAPSMPLPAGTFAGSMGNAQFQNLAPFAIADSHLYRGGPPPALDSHAYAEALNTVKQVGADDGNPSANATFTFWKLPGGSNQPPGAWLQIAQAASASTTLRLADTARLFALAAMAMADTVAPTYSTKATYYRWRPYEAINRADEDGNAETDRPATPWTARGGTSSSPEYWSGHSSFAAAGATVLAAFFCNDAMGFSLRADKQTDTRTYDRFSTAAFETGYSRVLGGQHFPTSNQAGLVAGTRIANEVLDTALLREHGPTRDRDGCPR